MGLKVYDSLTKRRQEFRPLRPGKVGIYVCGPTVYDQAHIGHARTFIAFDGIVRYLRYKGYEVTYVRNFTDVDDRIIKRAQEEGVEPSTISERYIKEFQEEMKTLRLLQPTHEPKVTTHIDAILALVQKLVDQNWAYVAHGSVYFDVAKFQDYGKLSRRNLEEMRAGIRVDIEPEKRNPLDFALWKASKPGEPKWPSPWGYGRPGWHIECSAMSMKYLGEVFDIHAGGNDLLFPHHDNELAQSEAAIGRPGTKWVKYWLHSGMVNVNYEKMSKSLGNYLSIKEALEKYHPEVIRFFVLSYHYRSNMDFSDSFVQEKAKALEKIYSALKKIGSQLRALHPVKEVAELSQAGRQVSKQIDRTKEEFIEALDDDFNTARAMGLVFDLVALANKFQGDQELVADQKPSETYVLLSKMNEFFSEAGKIFGFFQEDPEAFLSGIRERRLHNISVEEIEKLIQERNQARNEKNWKRADEIRQLLTQYNISLQDSPKGTTWTVEG